MSKSKIKALQILDLIKKGESVDSIKSMIVHNPNDWYSYSSKAYSLCLENAIKQRKKDEERSNVSATSNKDIAGILALNEILAKYALLLPIYSTMGDYMHIKSLTQTLPNSEGEILLLIGKITMHPRLRALQKKGRFDQFQNFNLFSKIMDAAILCYYRKNYISCYLTLLPIIEGVIIRWMGYKEQDSKPEFDEIRKFFKNSALRQPAPTNILFHNIYAKVCDKILNEHFYRPTTSKGSSYSNFNRHVASHLLNNSQFATKENCIRLFILLDAMTEIYFYESLEIDPRFNVSDLEILEDVELYNSIILQNFKNTPEQKYLKMNPNDL